MNHWTMLIPGPGERRRRYRIRWPITNEPISDIWIIGSSHGPWSAINHNPENIGCDIMSHPIFSVGLGIQGRRTQCMERKWTSRRNSRTRNTGTRPGRTIRRKAKNTQTQQREANSKEKTKPKPTGIQKESQSPYHQRKTKPKQPKRDNARLAPCFAADAQKRRNTAVFKGFFA